MWELVESRCRTHVGEARIARGDSKSPAIVGILSVFVYLAVALSLIDQLGFLALALGDAAKHTAHALMMSFLLWRWGGRLNEGVLRTFLQTLLAASIMGVFVYVSADYLLAELGTVGLGPRLLVLLIPGVIGAVVYYLLLRLMKVTEVDRFDGLLRRIVRH